MPAKAGPNRAAEPKVNCAAPLASAPGSSVSEGSLGEFRRGWLILVVATLAVGCGASLPLYSLPLFIAPLQAEFGWERTSIIQATVFLTSGLFIMAPFCGRLIDRFRVRVIATPSILLMGAVLLALSRMGGGIWQLHLGFGLIGIVGTGTTAVGYSRVIALWFRKNRGLGLGIMLSGISAVSVAAPIAMEASIRYLGWRSAFAVLAIWVAAMAPLVWVLLREPRQPVPSNAVPDTDPLDAGGLTRNQALRTRHFWLLAIIAFCIAIPISALIAHLVPLLGDRGLSRLESARLAALIGVGGLVGRIAVGGLIDRFHPPLVAAAIMAAAAIGCLLLVRSDALAAGIVLVGICLGSEGDLLAFFTARYFGLKAFSELFGWLYAAFAIGFTVGPLVASALYDRYGGYDQALIAFGCVFLGAALLQLMLGQPARDMADA